MLSKGLRDEESIRIDNVLKTLLSIVFVPKMLTKEDTINIENQLGSLGLTIQNLTDFNQTDLIEHLVKCHLNWAHLEQFADFLLLLSDKIEGDFSEKAIEIYNHIQKESKTFSFEIYNKIEATKKAN